eukprot:m.201866 g.201866  ORF g.201866 m.201866 type:complete len:184 (+) comp18430_c0_seq4:1117-1668(+)
MCTRPGSSTCTGLFKPGILVWTSWTNDFGVLTTPCGLSLACRPSPHSTTNIKWALPTRMLSQPPFQVDYSFFDPAAVLLPSLQAEIEQLERLVDATDQDTDVGTTLSLQPPTPSTKYAAPDAVVAGGGSDDGKTPLPHRHAGTPAATRFPGLLGHLRPLSLASTPSDAEAMARSGWLKGVLIG